MTKTITLAAMLLSAAALALSGAATAGDSKQHEHSDKHDKPGHQHADEHAAQHSDEDAAQHNEIHIELSSRMQQLNNITTEVAGKRTLVQNTALFGVIKAMPTAQYQIRAPYAGTLQQILVQQGDSVSKDQLLARISNAATLKPYAIHAPADGVVAERYFNDHELIRDEVLLRIIDYSKVYVELSAFPNDINRLQSGMPLTVFSLHHDQSAGSNISYIAPQMTEGHIARARAVLNNQSGYWRPGMHIKALVQSAEIPVALAVKKQAVQRLDGKQVIFVRDGNVFTATMPEFGREDEEYIEVLSGLQPGTEYATDNSFVLKADVLKSGASHAH
ncbi:efflux RND transporter periplasmic adaptor subunit [Rheinheimera sp. YQF-2]|uniref:Efflux RND transporter periplasmic adaptor subunit n=1 Tax=Rheinheimera lutimaris TaxID=2740584 RepID=A0A7Y5AT65_9GAMM|nr:efflux RND transporter periplasmic adaptor subunit [Rheinheimera lutimaris]NRQ43849.1 efflux RND transporter periplasmic adaptor subunit [Rheinheimera lutimaris]